MAKYVIYVKNYEHAIANGLPDVLFFDDEQDGTKPIQNHESTLQRTNDDAWIFSAREFGALFSLTEDGGYRVKKDDLQKFQDEHQ